MVTVTFSIKPHLAAYMYVRFKNHIHSAIHLPDTHPIYHFLHQLSVPPSSQCILARNRKHHFFPSPSEKRQEPVCI